MAAHGDLVARGILLWLTAALVWEATPPLALVLVVFGGFLLGHGELELHSARAEERGTERGETEPSAA